MDLSAAIPKVPAGVVDPQMWRHGQELARCHDRTDGSANATCRRADRCTARSVSTRLIAASFNPLAHVRWTARLDASSCDLGGCGSIRISHRVVADGRSLANATSVVGASRLRSSKKPRHGGGR